MSPGGETVIVTPVPGDPSLLILPTAVTADPTKFISVMLLIPKFGFASVLGTINPSSLIVTDPGCIPPPIGTQNLSPGRSINETT